jgi:hypothetical protein
MRTAKRDRRKEAFWRKAIGGQRRSGLCVRAWCRQHGLRESSFHWWRRELVRRDGESSSFASKPVSTGPQRKSAASPAVTLVPVQVTTDPSTAREFDSSAWNGSPSRIEIILPNQGRVRLTGPVDRQTLTNVLAVLRSESTGDRIASDLSDFGVAVESKPLNHQRYRAVRPC